MAKIKQDSTSCFKCVGQENICTYCQKGVNVRYGYTKGGNQRLRCTSCGKTRVKKYRYTAYGISDQQIVTLLSVRTCLKRFSRRSLCFSKSIKMLKAILKIYFWNTNPYHFTHKI